MFHQSLGSPVRNLPGEDPTHFPSQGCEQQYCNGLVESDCQEDCYNGLHRRPRTEQDFDQYLQQQENEQFQKQEDLLDQQRNRERQQQYQQYRHHEPYPGEPSQHRKVVPPSSTLQGSSTRLTDTLTAGASSPHDNFDDDPYLNPSSPFQTRFGSGLTPKQQQALGGKGSSFLKGETEDTQMAKSSKMMGSSLSINLQGVGGGEERAWPVQSPTATVHSESKRHNCTSCISLDDKYGRDNENGKCWRSEKGERKIRQRDYVPVTEENNNSDMAVRKGLQQPDGQTINSLGKHLTLQTPDDLPLSMALESTPTSVTYESMIPDIIVALFPHVLSRYRWTDLCNDIEAARAALVDLATTVKSFLEDLQASIELHRQTIATSGCGFDGLSLSSSLRGALPFNTSSIATSSFDEQVHILHVLQEAYAMIEVGITYPLPYAQELACISSRATSKSLTSHGHHSAQAESTSIDAHFEVSNKQSQSQRQPFTHFKTSLPFPSSMSIPGSCCNQSYRDHFSANFREKLKIASAMTYVHTAAYSGHDHLPKLEEGLKSIETKERPGKMDGRVLRRIAISDSDPAPRNTLDFAHIPSEPDMSIAKPALRASSFHSGERAKQSAWSSKQHQQEPLLHPSICNSRDGQQWSPHFPHTIDPLQPPPTQSCRSFASSTQYAVPLGLSTPPSQHSMFPSQFCLSRSPSLPTQLPNHIAQAENALGCDVGTIESGHGQPNPSHSSYDIKVQNTTTDTTKTQSLRMPSSQSVQKSCNVRGRENDGIDHVSGEIFSTSSVVPSGSVCVGFCLQELENEIQVR